MGVDRNENRRKWGIALVVTIVLLGVSLVMSVAAMSISEWLPLYFCWGNILLFSAVIIMLFGLITGNALPNMDRWWEGAGWGLFLGASAFALMAIIPSNYSDYADQMYNLACFGTMMALFAFALGAVMRRKSILLMASFSYFLWLVLFSDEVMAFIFMAGSFIVAALFLYWLNRVYPPAKSETDLLTLEDILNDPELIASIKEGRVWSGLSDDPDLAMAQLERIADAELPVTKNEDELPEWLMDYDTRQKEMSSQNPFPQDTFQEKNLLDKSSPVFLWIFALLLILVLFMLTFVAIFIR